MFELLVADVLRFAHLIAITVGFGVAVETEVFMIRRRRSAISPGMLSGLNHRHRVITVALLAMWVTGLALIALRTGFQLDAFTPKLWAKVTVVTILTVNAALVTRIALPTLGDHKGKRVAELPRQKRRALFSVAGISATSWLIAMALGSSAILKVSPAPVFEAGLPLAYIMGVLAANHVGARLFTATRRPAPSVPAQEAGQSATAPVPQNLTPAPAHKLPNGYQSEKAKVVVRTHDHAAAVAPVKASGPRIRLDPEEDAVRRAALRNLKCIVADLEPETRTAG